MPGQYEPEPATDPSRPPRHSIGRWVALGLAVVFIVVAVLVGVSSRQDHPPGPPAPSPGPGPAGPPLPRGQVVLGSGGTGQIHGVPVGFPSTPDGGVAAAVNFAALAHANPHLLVDEQRHAIEAAVYSPNYRGQRLDDATVAGLRTQLGLNEQGQPRDPATGGIDWSKQVRFQCLGQYGAYRVEAATPTHVEGQVWMPCVFGISQGSSTAGTQVLWTTSKSTVDNEDGQWRWTAFSSQPGPQPRTPNNPVVSYSERARLLGPGWQLPADASERPGWEGQ